MRFLTSLLRQAPRLEPGLAARVSRWEALPEPSLDTPLEEARFIVLDVETTGLDIHRSDLLSVGLVPVTPNGMDLGGLAEILVRREAGGIDKENLVVHGITPTESALAMPLEEALTRVLEHIGKTWLVAFHADFDRVVLQRVLRRHLGIRLNTPFLDLAWVMPGLFTDSTSNLRGLDDWLAHFSIASPARHRASGDALVTGELLLMALSRARSKGYTTVKALIRLARDQAQLDSITRH